MLTPKGEVKILDFGLAGFVRERKPKGSLTALGQGLGTPDFIAPEQIRDAHAADIRADIYSLGCTLYYLLTGKVPFPEGSVLQKVSGHLERIPRPVKEKRSDVPEGVVRIAEKMMAKEPGQRYQKPAEVVKALQSLESVLGRESPRNRRFMTAMLGLIMVTTVALAVSRFTTSNVPEVKKEISINKPKQKTENTITEDTNKTQRSENKTTIREENNQESERDKRVKRKSITSSDGKNFIE
jgi:serine/threonine protein kinase